MNDLSVLAGGALAGLAQTITGHPFDTVKVRYISYNLNINKKYSIRDCIKQIKSEGYRYFYKGVLTPMVSSVFINVQTFYIFSYSNTNITNNCFISGAITGGLLTFTESPTDLIKSRLQINSLSTYSDVIKNMKIKDITKGFNICLFRNILSTGLYFGSYSTIKQRIDNDNLGSLAGGIVAGVLGWAPIYPLDNIKTRLQTDTNNKYTCVLDCIRKTIHTEGYRGFGNGFIPCIIRAIIVNPFIFLAYEVGVKYF